MVLFWVLLRFILSCEGVSGVSSTNPGFFSHELVEMHDRFFICCFNETPPRPTIKSVAIPGRYVNRDKTSRRSLGKNPRVGGDVSHIQEQVAFGEIGSASHAILRGSAVPERLGETGQRRPDALTAININAA